MLACFSVGCLGGFLFAQACARKMVDRNRGTIIFTGATASMRGSANFVNLAVPKFGLRAVAQVRRDGELVSVSVSKVRLLADVLNSPPSSAAYLLVIRRAWPASWARAASMLWTAS
jgi:hypothetical protein